MVLNWPRRVKAQVVRDVSVFHYDGRSARAAVELVRGSVNVWFATNSTLCYVCTNITYMHDFWYLKFARRSASYIQHISVVGSGISCTLLGKNQCLTQSSEQPRAHHLLWPLRESRDFQSVLLYQLVKETAEQSGVSLSTVLKDLRNTFSVLYEELKEQFPPPNEAPGHEKRMTMMNTVLDRAEEHFLQVVGKLGVSKLTGSLKSDIKHVVVAIGVSRINDHSGTLTTWYQIMIQGTLLSVAPKPCVGPLGYCD